MSICNDNCIFRSEIAADREVLLILVMARIGLDEPQPEYLKCIIEIMKTKYFFSIMGGTPKKAHLFMKHHEGHFGFLDPHNTQKTVPFEHLAKAESEYTSKLRWIKEKEIDSSMAIAFYVPSEKLDDFWEDLSKKKAEMGESFFIYMAEEKPELDENAEIIEILDDDF